MAASPFDILLVTQDFPPVRGGIQTYVFELARQFQAKGHTVRVICPGRQDAPNPLPGCEVVRVGVHSSWLFLPLLLLLPRYLRAHPSITHVLYAQWQAALPLLLPGGPRKPKGYCLVHGRELLTSVLGPLAPRLRRAAFARLNGAVPNSRAVEALWSARTSGKGGAASCPMRIVHPGVDPGRFAPAAPETLRMLRGRYGVGDRPLIVSVTRMVARKNLQALVRALPAVLRQVPEAALILAGEGPERENLMALAGALGLSDRVFFPGRLSEGELVAHFSLGDVFALPSLATAKDVEGFGIVFLEAGACEVPVLGTDCGGIPDAVAHGESGLLVPPGDAPALETALITLLKDREKSKAMGRWARARIQSGFTWSHAADRLLAFMA